MDYGPEWLNTSSCLQASHNPASPAPDEDTLISNSVTTDVGKTSHSYI